ncbi:MAG: DUF3127 domain-containing protein [Muribaculaceae bacterium]
MEVEGKIIHIIGERSGTSQRGNAWKVKEYVLETINESFPRKIAFDFFGDKADLYPLNEGDMIKLSFDIESREYQGRWFTSIRGWKAEALTPGVPASAAAAPTAGTAPVAPAGIVPPPPVVEPMANNGEDLPF